MSDEVALAERNKPLVSVVIASVNGLPSIVECLEALASQTGDTPYEALVVDCCDEQTRQAIRERFHPPTVKLIPVEERLSIPKLRAIGMQQATGRMIAILEDHCNVCPEWLSVIARAHESGWQAVGGAVENGSEERLTDWAVFFCEYVRFMLPLSRGVVHEITGNNSVYDRALLDRLGPVIFDEVWESFLHAKIKELGVAFHCEPDMVVSHKKEFGFGYFLSQRYHYSRSFAGMRAASVSWAKRLVYAFATPLLPPLLLWRMIRTVRAKKRHVSKFILSLPIIGVFLLSWAWGEFVGALLGPGDSLSRVE